MKTSIRDFLEFPIRFKALVLACLVLAAFARAGADDALSKLPVLAELFVTLQKTQGYSGQALLTTTLTDEVLKTFRAAKVQKDEVYLDASLDAVRVRLDRLNAAGSVEKSTTWYSNAQQKVYTEGDYAFVGDFAKPDHANFIPNYDPFMWMFSFLSDDIDSDGPQVLKPSLLADRQRWESIAKTALAAPQENVLIFPKPSGSFEVKFASVELNGIKSTMPSEVLIKDKAGEVIWRGSVTEWQESSIPYPKAAMQVSTLLNDSGKRIDASIWEWSDIQLKTTPLPQDDLVFDPASVSSIFDDKSGTLIQVPR